MSLLWREKRDGRRAPGYAVYLVAGAATLGLIVYLQRRTAPLNPSPARSRHARGAQVAAITGPAALVAPVAEPPKRPMGAARSYRMDTQAGPAEPSQKTETDSFDPIRAALARPEDNAAGSEKAGNYPVLPPAFPPYVSAADAHAGAGDRSPHSAWLGYRDPVADAPSATGGQAVTKEADILPRATLVPVILLTAVDTSDPAAMLQFGVARDVVFRRRCAIPFGTRLLGKLSGHPMRDRLALAADSLLCPDGSEAPLAAMAVEAGEDGSDIRPGIQAQYFPPPAWAQTAPYLADFFTGFMGLLQSRAQQPFSVGVGGISLQAGVPESARAPAYQASSQAVQDFVAARLKEVEQRYASYHYIPAGQSFWLQLSADLNLAPLRTRSGLSLSQSAPYHAPSFLNLP